MPRIALIHAVQVAMAPIEAAFVRLWPEAERCGLLDDSLSTDLEKAGDLTPPFFTRMDALAGYCVAAGADAVLFTCSAFGAAIAATAARQPVPVLKPNEAMFDAALRRGGRIGMLATFAPSVPSMEAEFVEMALARGSTATLETICVPAAMAALKSGDGATHDRLLAEAAPRLAGCDAILLAHFSTSRAEDSVAARVDRPVLTSPGSAVTKLREALGAA